MLCNSFSQIGHSVLAKTSKIVNIKKHLISQNPQIFRPGLPINYQLSSTSVLVPQCPCWFLKSKLMFDPRKLSLELLYRPQDRIFGAARSTKKFIQSPDIKIFARINFSGFNHHVGGQACWVVPVFSTLIGRGLTILGSHWSRAAECCLRQQSYAIKNQPFRAWKPTILVP